MKNIRRFRFLSLVLSLALLFPLAAPTQVQAAAISITAASFVPSAYAVYLPGRNYAGATITAGQAVYLDTTATVTAGQVKLADADGAGNAVKAIGFASNGASAGQPIKVVIRDPQLTLGGAVTAGAIILLHTTAGAVTLTAADVGSGAYVCVMGVGISTTKINFGGTQNGNNYIGVVRADVAVP